MLEVEKIKTFENKNSIPSSQNIVINNFLEEVDKDGVCDQTNIIIFIGQIFLSEEVFIFYKRYAYYHGFSIRKGRFIKKNGIIGRNIFFVIERHRSIKRTEKKRINKV